MFDIARRGAVAVTPFFDLVLAWNTGISYGWFSDRQPTGQVVLLAIKAVAVMVLAIWMARSQTLLATVALGLIIGGAIGNGIDRLLPMARWSISPCSTSRSADKTYNWYVFNLADVAIVAGVAALLYDSLPGGTRRKSALIPADTNRVQVAGLRRASAALAAIFEQDQRDARDRSQRSDCSNHQRRLAAGAAACRGRRSASAS